MKRIFKADSESGSVLVVVMVAVVLGMLGGSAVVMSTSHNRKDTQESLRYSAKVACRAIAEQAALMIHNGSCDLMIDHALGEPKEIPFKKDAYQLILKNSVRTASGARFRMEPKVFILASVVDASGKNKLVRSAMNQWKEIYAEVQNIEDPAKRKQSIEFWERVRDDKEVSQYANAVKDGTAKDLVGQEVVTAERDENEDSLDLLVNAISLNSFRPRDIAKKKSLLETVFAKTEPVERKGLEELMDVYKLFGEITIGSDGARVGKFTPGKKPSAEVFKATWEKGLRRVGEDAASRIQSCGSNPASAFSHLIGDLAYNEEIASGTEVNVTNRFMYSGKYGDTTTYLIQLKAVCPYELSGGRLKGEVEYTTYRLFQKAPWEKAIIGASKSLVKDLIKHGMTEDDIKTMWPPKEDPEDKYYTEEHSVPVQADSSVTYDPYEVMMVPLKGVLPSSVGSRLYPYTLCATSGRS